MAPLLASARPPRFALERQQHIADRLREVGRVEVSALAAAFDVSEDTIRRDLRLLARRGLVQKTHGGAVAVRVDALHALDRRTLLARPKQAIADAALRRVESHQCLFLDAGSTTLALAQRLRDDPSLRPLTIVTHAFDIAQALLDEPGIDLVLAGGRWSPGPRVFDGPPALAAVRAHRADIAFLGACALHPRAGLTASEAGEAAVKRAMLDGAGQRLLLSDASKLDAIAPHAVAAIEDLDLLITDQPVDWLAGRLAVECVEPVGDAPGQPASAAA